MADKYDPREPGDEKGFYNNDEDKKAESEFNTEKFYASDDDYQSEKISSYSHYSDYDDGARDQAGGSSNQADDFFAKDERIYSDNLSTRDVEKIVDKKAKEMKTPFWKYLLAGLIGALIVIGLLFLLGPRLSDRLGLAQGQAGQGQVNSVNIQPMEDANVEVAVYEKCKDSVVGITTKVPRTINGLIPLQAYAEGVGSGVIVSEDGYILTNSHVVSDGQAETINVILSDQESYEGELVWYEPQMDLAVVKIDQRGLKAVELGNSEEVRVGDKAIAIGNPLGMDLQSTLTSGYVSGLDRSITVESGNTMDGLIQTDAAINSGNSGGALLNSQGQLIGINTAKASADNIGFAIPIDTAKVVVDRVQNADNFEPVTLGISGVDLEYYEGITGEESEVDSGVVVIEVANGTPAAAAGLKAGDIITKIGDKEISSMGQLRTQLLAYKPGDTADIEVVRNNTAETITIKFSGRAI